MIRRYAGPMLACLLCSATASAGEPDNVGPFEIREEAYDFGDEAFTPMMLGGRAVELRGAVYSPDDLSGGPFPLIVMMHGRHSTCFDPANPGGSPGDGSFNGGFGEWPCSGSRIPIPSHEGYAFLGERLASHGFIVASISVNAINVFDNTTSDFGMTARADLLGEHLQLWAGWNNGDPDPFGGRFAGAVDLDRLGLMGHSRGGEGVAKWIALDQAAGKPDFADAALLIAPVDFERLVIGRVPIAVVLPYCDGDVFDLSGAHYFDDARTAVPGDSAPKYTFLMDGSNHNFYNTIWSPGEFVGGSIDDFEFLEQAFGNDPYCGTQSPARLSEPAQRDSLVAYALAFFRAHLQSSPEFDDVLRGDIVPTSAMAARPSVTYAGPDVASERLDVNTLASEAFLAVNDLGGEVNAADAPRYGLCGLSDPVTSDPQCVDAFGNFQGEPVSGQQPHTPGLGQLRIELAPGGVWNNELPVGTDVSQLTMLQLRLAIDFESNVPQPTADVELTLADRSGVVATVSIGEWSDALDPPRGTLFPVLPKKVLRGIRIPLTAFVGVDLGDLERVSLSAGAGGSVALMLSDIGFSDALPEEPAATGSSGGPSTTTSGPATTTTGDDTSGGTGSGNASTSGGPGPVTAGGSTLGEGETETDTDGLPGESGNGGCACRSSGGGGGSFAWLLLLGFGWALRRRAAT